MIVIRRRLPGGTAEDVRVFRPSCGSCLATAAYDVSLMREECGDEVWIEAERRRIAEDVLQELVAAHRPAPGDPYGLKAAAERGAAVIGYKYAWEKLAAPVRLKSGNGI